MTNIVIAPMTAKKALKHGIDLTTKEREGVEFLVAAFGTKKERREWLQSDEKANVFLDAVIDARAYEEEAFEGIEEDEAVVIEQITVGDGLEFVARFYKGGKPRGELARDPVLSDLVLSLNSEDDPVSDYAAGIREDLSGDDDEKQSGSVVPDVFKRRYAEAGHAGHCGDWLAVTLNGLVQTVDGKKVHTDLDRLGNIAKANEVDVARVDKLGTATPGWQGRYRMTVRNLLTKKVADKGHLMVPKGAGVDKDTKMEAPADWCEKNKTKVKPKKVAKEDTPLARAQTAVAKKAAKKAAK